LEELWDIVDELSKQHFPENSLKPILGNGRTVRPKVMFVFINPTHANISSDKNWQGPRFPFIGTKPIWRIFHRARLFDSALIEKVR
jgi:DNA polymerase